MLISEYAEVVINGSNKKYYESLGYIIPKYKDKYGREKYKKGQTIKVKVSDLQKTSRVEVEVQCDYCGENFLQPFVRYNRSKKSLIKKDCCGKTICQRKKERRSDDFKIRCKTSNAIR